MSRLEDLLSTTSQDKLAATYFTKATWHRRQRAVPMWAVLLGGLMGGGLLGAAVVSTGWSIRTTPVIRSVLSFEEHNIMSQLGDQFGLWWSHPEDDHQEIALELEPRIRVGSEGHALAIRYKIFSRLGQVGVWFKLPPMRQTFTGDLAFHVRGDPQYTFTEHAMVELIGPNATTQMPIEITPLWREVRVPLNGASAGHTWNEARILVTNEAAGPIEGRVLIDQVQLVRSH